MELAPDLEVCARVLIRGRMAHFNLPNWARHLLPLARRAGLTIACDIQDVVDPYYAYRRDFILLLSTNIVGVSCPCDT